MVPPYQQSLRATLIQSGVLHFVLVVATITIARQPGNVATIWLANALTLAYTVGRPSRTVILTLLVMPVANFLGNLAVGNPAILSLTFSSINSVEVMFGAFLIRHTGVAVQFEESPANLLRFIAVACLVTPLVGATLAGFLLSSVRFSTFSKAWPLWYTAKAIGAVTVLPLALLVLRDGARAFLTRIDRMRLALLAALVASVNIGACIYLPVPLIYVMALLIMSAVTLRFESVAVMIVLVSAVTTLLNLAGYYGAPRGASGWPLLLFFLPFVLTLTPPLLLAASQNQARLREKVRQQVERSLERSHAEMQTIIDHMPAMVGYWDMHQRNRFGNRAYMDWFGVDPLKMRGKSLREVIGEELYAGVQPLVDAALSGTPSLFERTVLNRHGEVRHTLASYVPDRSSDDTVNGFYVFVTDVTPLKRAQNAEVKARSQLQQMIDAASEFSIIATDPLGLIQVFSVGAQRMLGYAAEEMIGRRTPVVLHLPQELASHAETLRSAGAIQLSPFGVLVELARQGQADSREWTYRRKDGSTLPVRLVMTAMRDANGTITGYLGMANDIEEQKQLQASLLQAKDAAEAASRAKSAFVANMSHEIRTPMNAVLGMAHLLGSTGLAAHQQTYLTQIRSAGESLLGILNDILDFSKIEAGRMELSPTPFRLDDLIDGLRAVMSINARAKDLALSIEIAPSVPRLLFGDALRLQQILINLTGNAIKFTERGNVALRIDLDGPCQEDLVCVRFRICDTGIGIDPAQQAALFSSFVQADASTTRRFGGTGLGLAICKRLCELMDGTIEVESRRGQGSVFSIRLPLGIAAIESMPPRQKTPTELAPSSDHALGLLQDLRLLLVEDNPLNQEVARGILEQAGAIVDAVDDGSKALSVLRTGGTPYDLVLMDIQMPVMDGLSASWLIRNALGLRLPILALTAGVMVTEQAQCIAAGMDGFIGKPIDVERALPYIAHHARQSRASAYPSPTEATMEAPLTTHQVSATNKPATASSIKDAQPVPNASARPETVTPPLMPSGLHEQPVPPVPDRPALAALPAQPNAPASPLAPVAAAQSPARIFDIEALARLGRNDPAGDARVRHLVGMVLEYGPPQMQAARDAWEGPQPAQALPLLHTLRGTFGTIGATRLTTASLAAEQALRADPGTDTLALSMLLDTVLREYDLSMRAARNWFDGAASPHNVITLRTTKS